MKNAWVGWVILTVMFMVSFIWMWFLSKVVVFLFALVGVAVPLWVAFGVLMLFEFLMTAIFKK